MRNFLLGVAVGAVGMGVYTGHIKLTVDGKQVVPPTESTTTEGAQSA